MAKCPSKACVCAILAAWQVLATLTLTVCCFVYLSPYLQIARLRLSRCRVESSFYTTQFICDCGWNCRSRYPCYLVHVSLNDSYNNMHTVGLYIDDNQQRRVEDEQYEQQQEVNTQIINQKHQWYHDDVYIMTLYIGCNINKVRKCCNIGIWNT